MCVYMNGCMYTYILINVKKKISNTQIKDFLVFVDFQLLLTL